MRKACPDGGVIRWGPPDGDNVAAPAASRLLLERAIAARPGDALLHVRLADLALDRFDFAAAAASLETALRLDPAAPGAARRLARCLNALGRHREALDRLGMGHGKAEFERGLAFAGLGRAGEAEAEFRALLAADPNHRHGCRQLCRLLRKSGRIAEWLAFCEDLHARGVGHTQLLYDWGVALALAGLHERARALLFDPARVAEIDLPVPEGFADIAAFNAALAEEILASPYKLGDFPEDEANRGSQRVHSLFAGRRPELFRALLGSLQRLAAAWSPPSAGPFDPWAEARPAAAHLKAWGLIQQGADHEAWHFHRGGWLSGVYYVRLPGRLGPDGAGCIEYGAPPALARTMPDFVRPRRYTPRPGMLLLAPSHYPHRTIPTGAEAHRISFAFDVVPDR